MPHDVLSPELALVDPELRARARVSLPYPDSTPRPRLSAPSLVVAAAPPHDVAPTRPYPFWARVTAALWLLVIGILIGGAAIPHAQDRPRVVPPDEDAPAVICEAPAAPSEPTTPPPGSLYGP